MSDFVIGFTSIEQIMWTVVRDCPTNGSGPCAFVHTCVDYETGDDGVVRPVRRGGDPMNHRAICYDDEGRLDCSLRCGIGEAERHAGGL